MLNRLIPVVAACVLALPIAANANVVTINFNNLANNTVLTNQYSALGVTFSAFENNAAVGSVVGEYNGFRTWSNCYNGFCNDRADFIRIDFANAVSNVSWMTDSAGGSLPVFRAYGSNNELLQTVSALGGIGFQATSFSASGIAYITGQQPNDNWAYLVDNLSFNANAVPEPVSISLFGLGLAGIAALRRRTGAAA